LLLLSLLQSLQNQENLSRRKKGKR